MRKFAALLVSISWHSAASAQSTNDVRLKAQTREIAPFVLNWQQCVVSNAQKFARSNDTAEFLAKTAMRSCDEAKQRMGAALFHVGMETKMMLVLLEMLDRDTEQMAAVAILEIRAR